jgi:hypothetical protein
VIVALRDAIQGERLDLGVKQDSRNLPELLQRRFNIVDLYDGSSTL